MGHSRAMIEGMFGSVLTEVQWRIFKGEAEEISTDHVLQDVFDTVIREYPEFSDWS